jgi:hypothetical protein
MVAKEPGHQGELEAAVKTIAQGRPDVSAYLWLLTRVLSTIAHAAAGALGTRSSLRPLIYGWVHFHAQLGRLMPREGGLVSRNRRGLCLSARAITATQ